MPGLNCTTEDSGAHRQLTRAALLNGFVDTIYGRRPRNQEAETVRFWPNIGGRLESQFCRMVVTQVLPNDRLSRLLHT